MKEIAPGRRRVYHTEVARRRAAGDPRKRDETERAPIAPRSAHELCTVHFAAERLKVHRKTVLRFIREGRLRANRIGKSYRILRADLDAFAGVPAVAVPAEPATVTSIVDVPGVSSELAQKWARTVPAALHAKTAGETAIRADVIYDAERAHLKIVLVGAPPDTVKLLGMIRVWLEQLRP